LKVEKAPAGPLLMDPDDIAGKLTGLASGLAE